MFFFSSVVFILNSNFIMCRTTVSQYNENVMQIPRIFLAKLYAHCQDITCCLFSVALPSCKLTQILFVDIAGHTAKHICQICCQDISVLLTNGLISCVVTSFAFYRWTTLHIKIQRFIHTFFSGEFHSAVMVYDGSTKLVGE